MFALQTRRHVRPQGRVGSRHLKTVVRLALQKELFSRIRPGVAVEFRQRHAAPVQVGAADRVAVNLDVHDDCAGLLDLSNLPQLDVIAEPGREVGAERIAAHVSRRHARHHEEHGRAANENHQHQPGCDPRQREGQVSMFLGIVGMPRLNVGRMPGTPHFHQHKRSHRHHHEHGEAEQEDAVDGQHGRGQHHQERQDRQGDVVALAA